MDGKLRLQQIFLSHPLNVKDLRAHYQIIIHPINISYLSLDAWIFIPKKFDFNFLFRASLEWVFIIKEIVMGIVEFLTIYILKLRNIQNSIYNLIQKDIYFCKPFEKSLFPMKKHRLLMNRITFVLVKEPYIKVYLLLKVSD